ncbi:WD-repeat protein-like protein, partial [Trifolium medium]|nr:WD-repeat protein-like protein [Trifolium medium]
DRLRGHLDYYYASAWHPEGYRFATGNQDRSYRVWDAQNAGHPLFVLKGNIGVTNAIRFSSDGKFMAMAEYVDYVHIYNVEREFEFQQEIDFFGKTS